jgi:hypothetical protein
MALLVACSAPVQHVASAVDGGQLGDAPVVPIDDGPPPPELLDAPPASISEAPDGASRLFACMEYSHVTLLLETDKRDYQAVVDRLGELRGGKAICFELVRRILKGYSLAINAFEAEWDFYVTYFALTAEAFADHNAETFCQHLGQTVRASKAAVSSAREYLKWLNTELASSNESSHPTIQRMSEAATEKVTGLIVASSELRDQYRSQCK